METLADGSSVGSDIVVTVTNVVDCSSLHPQSHSVSSSGSEKGGINPIPQVPPLSCHSSNMESANSGRSDIVTGNNSIDKSVGSDRVVPNSLESSSVVSNGSDAPQPLTLSKSNNLQEASPPGQSSGDFLDIVVLPMSGSMMTGSLSNLTFSFASLDDACSRIEELLRENWQLQEDLKTTNATMRKLYGVLSNKAAQEEADKRNLRDKFEQARTTVLNLKQELVERDSLIVQLKDTINQLTQAKHPRNLSPHEPGSLELDVSGFDFVNLDSQQLQEKVDQLTAELHRSQGECEKHQRNESRLTELIHELNIEKANYEISVNKVREGMMKLKEKCDRLEMEKRELVSINSELSVQVNSVPCHLEKTHLTGSPVAGGSQPCEGSTEVEELAASSDSNQENVPVISKMLAELEAEQEKVVELQTKNEQLKSKNNIILEELSAIKKQHQEEVCQLTEKHKQDQSKLIEQLEKLREELCHFQTSEPPDVSLKHKVRTLISQLNMSETKVLSVQQIADTYQERCTLLQSKLDMCYEHNNKLMAEKDQLSLQKKELHLRFEELLNDHDKLLQQMPRVSKAERQQQQERIDTLTAQLICAEEAMHAKEKQIHELKSCIAKLQEDVDSIAILKAQAEVFRLDFEAERNARVAIHDEREQLQEELKHQQLQIHQLEEELQSYSLAHFNQIQQRHAPPSPVGQDVRFQESQDLGMPGWDTVDPPPNINDQTTVLQRVNQSAEMSEEPITYQCPICNMVCPDQDTLQIHVEDCLTD